jgi:hypothetical protein
VSQGSWSRWWPSGCREGAGDRLAGRGECRSWDVACPALAKLDQENPDNWPAEARCLHEMLRRVLVSTALTTGRAAGIDTILEYSAGVTSRMSIAWSFRRRCPRPWSGRIGHDVAQKVRRLEAGG